MTRIEGLRVDDREHALTVTGNPRFSWRRTAWPSGESHVVHVHRGDGSPVWSSAPIPFPVHAVVYDGPLLPPLSRLQWTVESSSGDVAHAAFETAPDIVSWDDAAWISIPRNKGLAADRRPIPHLRTRFEVRPGVRRARVHATAGGLFRLSLDGERIGSDVLAPGWTDYRFRVPFHGYELPVHPGTNVLSAQLGDGWYSGFLGPFNQRDIWGEDPAFRAIIALEYDDGTELVPTSTAWEGGIGEVQGSDLLHGDVVDARRKDPQWSAPPRTGGWSPVIALPGPDGALEPSMIDSARPVEEFPARQWTERGGSTIVDFGQNLAGRVRLHADGPAGTIVRVRHAEVLDADGELYLDNLRGARATDTYLLSGEGRREFEPTFSYHGFRYAEVTAPPGVVDIASATSVAISGLDRMTATLDTDVPMLNRLWENILWSARSNFIEVPTDCPQRDERLGWGGDALAFAPTAMIVADTAAFFRKWSIDLLDAQKDDGAFADIAPGRVLDFAEIGAPGYADAGALIPWYAYEAYGDRRVLERALAGGVRWIEYLERHNPDLIVRTARASDYGDWQSIEHTDKTLVATAYFAHSTHAVAQSAREVGDASLADRLDALHGRIATAFWNEFGTSTEPSCRSQAALALTLAFGLAPPDAATGVAAALADEVATRGHATVGFLAVRHLLPALTAIGRTDLAMRLLLRTEAPSLGHQVEQGMTTVGEHWNPWNDDGTVRFPWMNSFNHFCLGAVGEWMHAELGAIARTSPGWRTFRVRPAYGFGVSRARATFDSPYGRITTDWHLDGSDLRLEVVVPAGTAAEVVLPDRTVTVGEGHHEFTSPISGSLHRV